MKSRNQYQTHALTQEHLLSSFAEFALGIYGIQVPQKIGSTALSPTDSDILDVIPKLAIRREHSAKQVFDSLEAFFTYLFDYRRSSPMNGEDKGNIVKSQAVLDGLAHHVWGLLKKTKAGSLRRCVLRHDDLNDRNILASDEGNITGIVDWEYHSVQPAILAVEYPPWLLYDGPFNPKFASVNTVWLDSADESARMCHLYEEVSLLGDWMSFSV